MKAIFFDLFETLVSHFDPDWVPPPQSIAQRLGIDEYSFHELWIHYDAAWQLGEIRDYTDALAQVCIATGRQPDVAILSRLSYEYQFMTARVFERIEPEIVEMMAALQGSGFKLGVITNAGDLDTEPWADCSLASFVDIFIASHEIGMLKRDQKIFEYGCQSLSLKPTEAVFVGDGGGNELWSAARTGLRVYWSSWFLDRWPEGIRPNKFPGDEWRQYSTVDRPPFERLKRPSDLLVAKGQW